MFFFLVYMCFVSLHLFCSASLLCLQCMWRHSCFFNHFFFFLLDPVIGMGLLWTWPVATKNVPLLFGHVGTLHVVAIPGFALLPACYAIPARSRFSKGKKEKSEGAQFSCLDCGVGCTPLRCDSNLCFFFRWNDSASVGLNPGACTELTSHTGLRTTLFCSQCH